MTTAQPVPRRRRTIVCGSLRADGRAPEWDWVWGLLGPTAYTLSRGAKSAPVEWSCEASGRRMTVEYVADVCATSWCRHCPFQEGGTVIVPLGSERSRIHARSAG